MGLGRGEAEGYPPEAAGGLDFGAMNQKVAFTGNGGGFSPLFLRRNRRLMIPIPSLSGGRFGPPALEAFGACPVPFPRPPPPVLKRGQREEG